MKAEAYELHGAAQAPLSQFKLPHIAEHVRALSRGKANSTYCPRSFLAAMHNEDGKSRTECRMLVRKAEVQKGVNCLITEPKLQPIQASDAGLILLTYLKQTGFVTMKKKARVNILGFFYLDGTFREKLVDGVFRKHNNK